MEKILNRVGESDVYYGVSGEHISLRLPIPPSTNARQKPQFRTRGYDGKLFPVMVHTEETKAYLQNIYFIRSAMAELNHKPIADYTPFTFRFFLKNMRYDAHNGLKLACDVLEMGGVVKDDNFIVVVTEVPIHAPSDPRLLVSFQRRGGMTATEKC